MVWAELYNRSEGFEITNISVGILAQEETNCETILKLGG
jgi:hypothetical protein